MHLRNCIHHYLGCQVYDTFNDVTITLTPMALAGYLEKWEKPEQIMPILRKLEDMVPVEMRQLLIARYHPNEEIFLQTIDEIKFAIDEPKRRIKHGHGVGFSAFKDGAHKMTGTLSFSCLNATQFAYLLECRFDLFNLIDTKQAKHAGRSIDALPTPTRINWIGDGGV